MVKRKAVWIVLGIMLIGASCMAASAREESAVNSGRRALELSMGLEWAPEENISGEAQDVVEILYVEIQPGGDAQNAVTIAGNRNAENQENNNQTGTAVVSADQPLNGQQPENQQNDLPNNPAENGANSSDGSSDHASNSSDASTDNDGSLPDDNGSSEGSDESSGGSPNSGDNNSSGGSPNSGDNNSSGSDPEEGGNQPDDDTDNQEGEDDPIESPEVSGGDL